MATKKGTTPHRPRRKARTPQTQDAIRRSIQVEDAKTLENAHATVRAFTELTGALTRAVEAVMRMSDGAPARARSFLAMRAAFTRTGNLDAARHSMALVDSRLRGLFQGPRPQLIAGDDGKARFEAPAPNLRWLETEPDMVAASVVAAAERLAPVMAVLGDELAAAAEAEAFLGRRAAKPAARQAVRS